MTTKVQKWGNSYAVRIPKEIIREMNFHEGSQVSFSVKGESIILNHSKKTTYTLEELLKDFDITKQHQEIDWGEDVGSEILEKW
jgi:antitoxin MazE